MHILQSSGRDSHGRIILNHTALHILLVTSQPTCAKTACSQLHICAEACPPSIAASLSCAPVPAAVIRDAL